MELDIRAEATGGQSGRIVSRGSRGVVRTVRSTAREDADSDEVTDSDGASDSSDEHVTRSSAKRFTFKSSRTTRCPARTTRAITGPRTVARYRTSGTSTAIVPSSYQTVEDHDREYDIKGEFRLEFPAAGELGKMIDYINGTRNKATSAGNYYELNEEGLLYVGIDTNKIVSNYILIRRENLTSFSYYTESGKPYRFYMDIASLKDKLKSYKKDRRLCLSKNLIHDFMLISERPDESDGVATIKLSTYNEVRTKNRPSFEYDVSRPHAVIATNSLKDACKTITNKKKVKLVLRADSLIMFKIDEQTEPTMQKFPSNDPTNKDETVLEESFIPSPIAKNLSKLQAMSPNGAIQVYYKKGEPLLLKLQYCFLGDAHIYIMLS